MRNEAKRSTRQDEKEKNNIKQLTLEMLTMNMMNTLLLLNVCARIDLDSTEILRYLYFDKLHVFFSYS